MADWSALPEGLLAQIAERLMPSLADRYRFGHVCRSWRSASAGTRPRARPHVPFLVAYDKARCSLLDVTSHEVFGACEFPTQEYCCKAVGDRTAEPSTEVQGWQCFGAGQTWLGMVSERLQCCLLNPVSGKVVPLPSLNRDSIPYDDSDRHVDVLPHKLCMSSPDPRDPSCIIMVTYSEFMYPIYTRAGCERWSALEKRWFNSVENIIYHGGRFYAFSEFYGRLDPGFFAVIDVGDAVGGDPGPNKMTYIKTPPSSPFGHIHHLVGFPGGELVLLYRRLWDENDDGGRGPKPRFVAMKTDMGSGRRPREWEKLGDLGGRSIFVGDSCSLSISASTASDGGYRQDCIYFTEDPCFCAGNGSVGWVFDMKDGSVAPLYDESKLVMSTPPPLWIVPNNPACHIN